jgi:asparagine synthase (glutamine-hydrolysing)
MSGIAGVFNRDEAPVDRRLLADMLDVFAPGQYSSGLNEGKVWVNGSVGLGHRQLVTTAEASQEMQPLSDSEGVYWITFDGRIDNRRELIRGFFGQDKPDGNCTDAELTLMAYQKWGTSAPQKIIGDFAFAIWDARNRALFCATDPLGVRPLFYCNDGKQFLFGSAIRQVLQYRKEIGPLNEDYVAEFLVGRMIHVELTPFKDILRLYPGSALVVNCDGLRKVQYWNLEPQRQIRYQNRDDYIQHFRELFWEAVACSLRSSGPICADLSGGLDSSSIVSIAQEIYRQESRPLHSFFTLSIIYDAPPTHRREQQFIEAVQRKYQIPAAQMIKIKGEGHWLLRDVPACLDDGMIWDQPSGEMVYYAREREIRQGIQNVNAQVWLSGVGADELIGGSSVYLADLFRTLQFKRLHNELKNQLTYQPGAQYFSLLWKAGIRPLFWTPHPGITPAWIRSPLVKKVSSPLQSFNKLGGGFQKIYDQFQREVLFAIIPILSRNTFPDVELHYPFLYRPLIEYVIAIPLELKARLWPISKMMLREAMRDILPEEVRLRPFKDPGGDHRVYTGVRREWTKIEQWLQGMRLAELGYIDLTAFRRAAENARIGCFRFDKGEDSVPFIKALALELWLKMGLGKQMM